MHSQPLTMEYIALKVEPTSYSTPAGKLSPFSRMDRSVKKKRKSERMASCPLYSLGGTPSTSRSLREGRLKPSDSYFLSVCSRCQSMGKFLVGYSAFKYEWISAVVVPFSRGNETVKTRRMICRPTHSVPITKALNKVKKLDR